MLDIITDKTSKVVLSIGLFQGFQQENGYPVMQKLDGTLAAYVLDQVDLYQGLSVPEQIQELKYCYTPLFGFYENLDYIEPEEPDSTNTYGIPDEMYYKIKEQAVQEVRQEVQNGTV